MEYASGGELFDYIVQHRHVQAAADMLTVSSWGVHPSTSHLRFRSTWFGKMALSFLCLRMKTVATASFNRKRGYTMTNMLYCVECVRLSWGPRLHKCCILTEMVTETNSVLSFRQVQMFQDVLVWETDFLFVMFDFFSDWKTHGKMKFQLMSGMISSRRRQFNLNPCFVGMLDDFGARNMLKPELSLQSMNPPTPKRVPSPGFPRSNQFQIDFRGISSASQNLDFSMCTETFDNFECLTFADYLSRCLTC